MKRARAEHEKIAARRREYKEAMGAKDYVEQPEEAAEMLPEKIKRDGK